jgi:hypothetical protein
MEVYQRTGRPCVRCHCTSGGRRAGLAGQPLGQARIHTSGGRGLRERAGEWSVGAEA